MPERLKSKYEFAILKGGNFYLLELKCLKFFLEKIAGLNTNVPDAQVILCLIVFCLFNR